MTVSSLPEAAAARRRTLLAWGGVALLLLLQWGLVRQYVERELSWNFPRFFDQAGYLNLSYQTYEGMLAHGFFPGLWQGLKLPCANGLLLHVQAPLLYLVFAPSRLTALALVFFYFALFQILLVATLRRRSGSWGVAFFGMGLLLAATAPHALCGGLTDFRIDCVAFSLFGIVLCLVVRSDFFASWRWSLLTGLAAVLLVLFRFIAAAYLGGILGLWWLFTAARYAWPGGAPEARRALSRRLVGGLLAGLVLTALAGPVIYWKRQYLWDYYVANVALGGDGQVRAKEWGVTTPAQSYLFYVNCLFRQHTGQLFLILGSVGVLAAALARRLAPRPCPSAGQAPADAVAAWSFLLLSLLVPFAVLTASVSKSPVVGSILVPPLLWLLLLPVLPLKSVLVGRWRVGNPVAAVPACAALLCGLNVQFNAACRHDSWGGQRQDARQILALYDEVIRRCQDDQLRAPLISWNIITEFAAAPALCALAYERQGVAPNLNPALATSVLRLDEGYVRAALEQSDFVVLAGDTVLANPVYPFNAQMREMRAWMRAYCKRELILAGRYPILDTTYELYARPTVGFSGDFGGWVTSRGLVVTGSREALARRPTVTLSGRIDLRLLGRIPGVTVRLWKEEADEVLPATLSVTGDRYSLRFTVDPERLPESEPVTLTVRFDRFFVPRTLGINQDPRELVVQTPERVVLTR